MRKLVMFSFICLSTLSNIFNAAESAEKLTAEKECPPHSCTSPKGWYELKPVTNIFTQTWAAAHVPGGQTNPCITDLDFGFVKPMVVDGVESTFEMNFRPSDNPPTDCQNKPTKRRSCWYEGYFHYVSTSDDPNFGKMVTAAMKIDFTKSQLFIHFNPQNIDHDWYEIKIKPIKKQSTKPQH